MAWQRCENPELPLLLGSVILIYKLVPCGPLLGG
jgi:hypothetical protein